MGRRLGRTVAIGPSFQTRSLGLQILQFRHREGMKDGRQRQTAWRERCRAPLPLLSESGTAGRASGNDPVATRAPLPGRADSFLCIASMAPPLPHDTQAWTRLERSPSKFGLASYRIDGRNFTWSAEI